MRCEVYYVVNRVYRAALCKNNVWRSGHSLIVNASEMLTFPDASYANNAVHDLPTRSNVEICTSKRFYKLIGITPEQIHYAAEHGDANQYIELDDVDNEPIDTKSYIGLACNLDQTYHTELINETLRVLRDLDHLYHLWLERESQLRPELKLAEDQINDELHYAEFNALNIVKGYQSYKRIHDARVNRRRAKNEIFVYGMFQTVINDEINNAVRNAIASIEGLQFRKYAPRNSWPDTTQELKGEVIDE